MNRKILFSADGTEQFEIRRDAVFGFKILQVVDEQQAVQIGGNYRSFAELAEALVDLAVFSGDDETTLIEINQSIQSVVHSIQSHCSQYAGETW
ncbi:hypothetical protein E4T80_12110 [Muribacter muris]|uniref:Uncharacterized protein n=1 Tax=Muribacter muris TaxID=67855 RepID=A0A4Y9JRN4_9PAST|nr:hypothetical protein [Muribacter muris]MBF0786206.1 hypothetical protein [Muribacter muris]MBF0826461.1 hypothetical protein [Muribacter muris]TFV07569.1 hypothetical protein E4T80_12110 [Muribacter muris]